MDKLLELLGVAALNESDQAAIKEKLEVLIEAKAQEKLEAKLNEAKEQMVSEYEEKFEVYKDQALSKFSDFMDTILEQELEIPANIVEYARKGELYEDLIEEFKVRLRIDEGKPLDDEVKAVLKEAKEEITSLRARLDEATAENMEAKELLGEARTALYINELCEGLTAAQRSKIIPLLEGIEDTDVIDRKFGILREAFKMDDDEEKEDDDNDGEEDKGEESVDTDDESTDADGDKKKDKKEKKVEIKVESEIKGDGHSEVITEESKDKKDGVTIDPLMSEAINYLKNN